MIRTVPLALLALCAAACSGSVQAYEGDARDDTQVATILPENAYNRARQEPLGAGGNGEVRVRIGGHALGGWNNRFEVLPGRHQLSVAYLSRRVGNRPAVATRAVALPIDAEAGHVYAIRGTATWANGRPTVTIWALDGATRRTVASAVVPPSHVLVGEIDDWIVGDD